LLRRTIDQEITVTKQEALAAIKKLRTQINDTGEDAFHNPDIPASDTWVNQVVFHLDAASDVIEFPKER
jgi:hypothetical protein